MYLNFHLIVNELGGAGEDRTPDPLRARQVLSQLSYDPKSLKKTNCVGTLKSYSSSYTIKEVIQPQVPLRLPCYDFTPVMNHTVVTALLS